MAKKNPENLKDKIYSSILNDIIVGRYLPGDILNTNDLIEEYDVSRSPVRDALISLCSNGVLKSLPRYGYEVVRLSQEDIRNMVHFRAYIESSNICANLDKFGDEQIRILKRINADCIRDDVCPEQHWNYNTRFHLYLMEVCGNAYVTEQIQHCMSRLLRAYAQVYWNYGNGRKLSIDTKNHEKIIDSIRERNQEKIIRYLNEDLNDFAMGI
ncbi:MAG: GntR family transcriptional regulator [Peptoniphilaceae bacterium]|nr:GntR family transcriptional regulator [Peptoniphilaceae bacterium]MDD7434770.1 GntR family transcriptional regulator [Peptoniphilaceae bacterium]MDY3076435.1 GntR family transcriptional regulator [Peptoniphilaceae bacterium]